MKILVFSIALLACSAAALAQEPLERVFERPDISAKTPNVPPAPMKRAEFTHEGVTKSYALFSPPRTAATQARPLLVFLHGCTQSADEFAAATKMNELAIRENFYVLYPEQDDKANTMKCWSWFEPTNHDLKAPGQASERVWIAALTSAVAAEVGADEEMIFVAGFSAGAAMAVNLASCHPNLYAAVGAVAGVSFAAAGSVIEATKVMKLGSEVEPSESASRAFQCAEAKQGVPVPIIAIHGHRDLVVNRKNSRQVLDHFEAFSDFRDDGVYNDSARFTLSKKRVSKAKRGRTYTSEKYSTSAGETVAELINIRGLGHSWSGGAEGFDFTSPKGPQTGEILWNFFVSSRPETAVARSQ